MSENPICVLRERSAKVHEQQLLVNREGALTLICALAKFLAATQEQVLFTFEKDEIVHTKVQLYR